MPDFTSTNTFMSGSTVLQRNISTRTFFNPDDLSHQESLAKFIRTGNWGVVQFYPEKPFTDVPMTVLMKFAGRHLGVQRGDAEDQGSLHEIARIDEFDTALYEATVER